MITLKRLRRLSDSAVRNSFQLSDICRCNGNRINERQGKGVITGRESLPTRDAMLMLLFDSLSKWTPMSLCGSTRVWFWGWRPSLAVLAPVVPAQPCAVSDTCSTLLVSGSLSAEHHCHITKIVPGPARLLALYLS